MRFCCVNLCRCFFPSWYYWCFGKKRDSFWCLNVQALFCSICLNETGLCRLMSFWEKRSGLLMLQRQSQHNDHVQTRLWHVDLCLHRLLVLLLLYTFFFLFFLTTHTRNHHHHPVREEEDRFYSFFRDWLVSRLRDKQMVSMSAHMRRETTVLSSNNLITQITLCLKTKDNFDWFGSSDGRYTSRGCWTQWAVDGLGWSRENIQLASYLVFWEDEVIVFKWVDTG